MSKHAAAIIDAVEQMRAERKAGAERLEALRLQRQEVKKAPIATADILAAIRADMLQRRPQVLERIVERVGALCYHEGDLAHGLQDQARQTGGHRLLERDVDRRAIDSELLAIALEELLLRLVEEAFKKSPREGAMTLSKRRSELRRIDEEIRALERELKEIERAAATAGVGLG